MSASRGSTAVLVVWASLSLAVAVTIFVFDYMVGSMFELGSDLVFEALGNRDGGDHRTYALLLPAGGFAALSLFFYFLAWRLGRARPASALSPLPLMRTWSPDDDRNRVLTDVVFTCGTCERVFGQGIRSQDVGLVTAACRCGRTAWQRASGA
jgi:hypothetical protein